MVDFCRAEGIPHDVCGKVIVASSDAEVPQLLKIYERGIANGVTCELIDLPRLRQLEPEVNGVRHCMFRMRGSSTTSRSPAGCGKDPAGGW